MPAIDWEGRVAMADIIKKSVVFKSSDGAPIPF